MSTHGISSANAIAPVTRTGAIASRRLGDAARARRAITTIVATARIAPSACCTRTIASETPGASAIWNTFSGHAQSGLSPYPSSSHAICSGTTLSVAVAMIQRSAVLCRRPSGNVTSR